MVFNALQINSYIFSEEIVQMQKNPFGRRKVNTLAVRKFTILKLPWFAPNQHTRASSICLINSSSS